MGELTVGEEDAEIIIFSRRLTGAERVEFIGSSVASAIGRSRVRCLSVVVRTLGTLAALRIIHAWLEAATIRIVLSHS